MWSEKLKEDCAPDTILTIALISAKDKVGELFERQEFYLHQMLIAARAMKVVLNIIKPQLTETGVEPVGKIVLGLVKGDLHDLGKNLVGMMLEGTGFEIVDLGVDVNPGAFVEAARGNAHLLGLSALHTTTMGNMKLVIDALYETSLRERVMVIVSGAPVTQAYSDEIGADGYAQDASRAVTLSKRLIGK